MEYLRNMFSKPSVLWTMGEQLVMAGFVLLGLLIVCGIGILINLIVNAVKKRRRKNLLRKGD